MVFTLLVFGYGALFIICRNAPFFWDSIMLGSRVAHFYYDNNFSQLLLPEDIDAGHSPFFGILLAIVWKVFGYSLLTAHCLIFLFSIMILWQLKEIVLYFIAIERAHWALFLSATLTPLLGQLSQISADVPVLAFYLWALANVLKGKNSLALAIALVFMVVLSTRGFLLFGSLYLLQLIICWINKESFKKYITSIWAFIPAGLLIGTWFGYHYVVRGWLFVNEQSQWSTLYQWVGITGIIKNIAVLGFRYLDLGLAPFTIMIVIGWWKVRKDLSKKHIILLIATLLPTMVLSIVLLGKANGFGQRYLLPSVVLLPIALVYCYELKVWQYVALAIISISGNCWIYPEPIAKSWDSTLAHLGYFDALAESKEFQKKKIYRKELVGTYFPALDEEKYTLLNNSLFVFDSARVGYSEYILYSPVFNQDDLPSDLSFQNQYELIHEAGHWPTPIHLYKLKQ